jgi:hypothetical protein
MSFTVLFVRTLLSCKLPDVSNHSWEIDHRKLMTSLFFYSGLGFIAIGFDIIFMCQHYILYRDRTDFYVNSVEEERQRLIAEGRLPRDTDDIFRRNRTDSAASASSGGRYV